MADKPKTVYDYPDIYKKLGMELGHFGCIMLNVEPIDVPGILDQPTDWFYFSQNPQLRYVKGPVGATEAHATLLYGLTPNDTAGVDQKDSVDQLLEGLDLSSVTVDHVDSFPSQFPQDPYACVVAKLKANDDLGEANRRLRFLPHIDTFVEFKPHVTLAYVREDELEDTISKLNDEIEGIKLQATGLNYGGPIV